MFLRNTDLMSNGQKNEENIMRTREGEGPQRGSDWARGSNGQPVE